MTMYEHPLKQPILQLYINVKITSVYYDNYLNLSKGCQSDPAANHDNGEIRNGFS